MLLGIIHRVEDRVKYIILDDQLHSTRDFVRFFKVSLPLVSVWVSTGNYPSVYWKTGWENALSPTVVSLLPVSAAERVFRTAK